MDPETVERVEAELDSFIEKRARQAKDAECVEELWAKSTARDRARRREENRTLWVGFHSRLSRSYARISAEHERRSGERGEGILPNGVMCLYQGIRRSL